MITKYIQKQIDRARQAIAIGEEWQECDCCGCWHPDRPIPLRVEELHDADCRNDEQRLPSHPEDYLGSLIPDEQEYVDSIRLTISRE